MKWKRRLSILGFGLITAAASQAVPHVAAAAASEAGQPAQAVHREVLPFIEDDYSKAFAEAQARQLPLFIESWAPW